MTAPDDTLLQCEDLATRLARLGGFIRLHYRLFPDTRNSFSPNYMQLGFNFDEMRQVSLNTELRFQLFPQDLVQPLRRILEDLRAEGQKYDEGPIAYTGDPFLTHERINQFYQQVGRTREQIRAMLRSELLDNYERMRTRAHEQLRATMETLLPHLGVGNTKQILDKAWFEEIFPSRDVLSADFMLRVHVYNVHPRELMTDERLLAQVRKLVEQPQQLNLFMG